MQGTTTVFPVGEPGPRPATTSGKAPVKLLTNVEKLRLLTKAERAGLLSAAERAGLSLSAMERLGLLSKLEELGALSAATDPGTPGALLALALPLLAAGPAVVYLVPEEQAWQVALQAVAALVCVVGGAAAVSASTFCPGCRAPPTDKRICIAAGLALCAPAKIIGRFHGIDPYKYLTIFKDMSMYYHCSL